MATSKFHNFNNVFITSKENINYLDVQKFMKQFLPQLEQDTKIYYVCGIHHNHDGELGETDPSLLSSFYETMFGNLENYCGNQNCANCEGFKIEQCTTSIWTQKRLDKELILISTMVSYQ